VSDTTDLLRECRVFVHLVSVQSTQSYINIDKAEALLARIDAHLAQPEAAPVAHDARRLISALQSFLDRLKNDARSGLMFEGDGDTLREAMTYIRHSEAMKRLAAPLEGKTGGC
jgi:hypothetical protein